MPEITIESLKADLIKYQQETKILSQRLQKAIDYLELMVTSKEKSKPDELLMRTVLSILAD